LVDVVNESDEGIVAFRIQQAAVERIEEFFHGAPLRIFAPRVLGQVLQLFVNELAFVCAVRLFHVIEADEPRRPFSVDVAFLRSHLDPL
jgi:hypothetical protein